MASESGPAHASTIHGKYIAAQNSPIYARSPGCISRMRTVCCNHSEHAHECDCRVPALTLCLLQHGRSRDHATTRSRNHTWGHRHQRPLRKQLACSIQPRGCARYPPCPHSERTTADGRPGGAHIETCKMTDAQMPDPCMYGGSWPPRVPPQTIFYSP